MKSLTRLLRLALLAASWPALSFAQTPAWPFVAPDGSQDELLAPPSDLPSRTGGFALLHQPLKLAEVCETYITITQFPPATYRQASANVTVEYGFIQTGGEGGGGFFEFCVQTDGPNTSTFHVELNGQDVTSYFNVGFSEATATLPLNNAVTNTMVVRMQGNDIWGEPRTDTDMRSTAVAYGLPAYPVVELATVKADSLIERPMCVSMSAGSSAGIECGDLRLVHPLPAIRTLGKVRAPMLIYNSQTAHPFPLVSAVVTLPQNSGPPDSVVARVKLADQTIAAVGRWDGWEWWRNEARSRRIVLGFDALNKPTGEYDYTLEVEHWYGNSRYPASAVQGGLIVVNRANGVEPNAFGAGWWFAGLERLYPGSGLWVGGDGSARVYRPVSSTRWVAPRVDRPDTIEVDCTPICTYTRRLDHGVVVIFDATGRHVETRNRLGQVTSFGYDASGRLVSITVPPTSFPQSYHFAYQNGVLHDVSSPGAAGARHTILRGVGSKIAAITDPSADSVLFTYDPSFSNRITGRTDRRGSVTTYEYDGGSKVARVRLNLGPGNGEIVTNLLPIESRGVPRLGVTATIDTTNAATRIDGPRTDVGDTTLFWQNRFGALTKVKNALGDSVLIFHEDGNWPALPSRVVSPSEDGSGTGVESRAYYNARGTLDSISAIDPYGDGRVATTRYKWDDRWDFVDTVTQPDGIQTFIAYDSVGNRLWQQLGDVASRRVQFRYDNLGRVVSTILPLNSKNDSLTYDPVTGNLATYRAPNGLLTYYAYDSIGNVIRNWYTVTDTVRKDDVRVYSVVDSTFYDAMGRDTLHIHHAQGDSSLAIFYDEWGVHWGTDFVRWAPSVLSVTKSYDEEGNLLHLTRDGAQLDGSLEYRNIMPMMRSWVYDRANRVKKRIMPGGFVDSTRYDAAGNAIVMTTRRGYDITMSYDALNRMTTRRVPAVDYPLAQYAGITMPHYFNKVTGASEFPTGIHIPQDVQIFAYSPGGQVVAADNMDAKVEREYYPAGALKSETQRIYPWNRYESGGQNVHVYKLQYGYDLDGRRTSLTHPGNLLIYNVGDSTTNYSYNDVGLLDTIVTPYSKTFAFYYDDQFRNFATNYPNGIRQTEWFDNEGHVMRRWINGGSTEQFDAGTIHDTRFTYDVLGRVRTAQDGAESHILEYAPAGYLAREAEGYGIRMLRHESFVNDALNNRVATITRGSYPGSLPMQDTLIYDQIRGTLSHMNEIDHNDNLISITPNEIDASGNVWLSNRMKPISQCYTDDCAEGVTQTYLSEITGNYYGADEKLRVNDRSTDDNGIQFPGGLEQYRYDALGRRVLRRFRRDQYCDQVTIGDDDDQYIHCTYSGETIRYVWDGDQILYEIQASGVDSASREEIERDLDPLARLDHGVALYTHSLTLDRPLAVRRVDWGFNTGLADQATAYLHQDWSGRFDMATIAGGRKEPQYGWEMRRIVPQLLAMHYHNVDDWHAWWLGSLLDVQKDGSHQVYMRNRYYDPVTGQFTQEDPIGLAGGMNLYGYAEGDPANFSDPFGLCVPTWACGLSFAIAGELVQHPRLLDFFSQEARGFACGIDGACMSYPPRGSAGWLAGRLAFVMGASMGGAAGRSGRALARGADGLSDGAATIHGAARMADASRLTPEAVKNVIANATRTGVQGDGAMVFVQETADRFNVVIKGDRGVITNFKNISQKSFERLAKNYEWRF